MLKKIMQNFEEIRQEIHDLKLETEKKYTESCRHADARMAQLLEKTEAQSFVLSEKIEIQSAVLSEKIEVHSSGLSEKADTQMEFLSDKVDIQKNEICRKLEEITEIFLNKEEAVREAQKNEIYQKLEDTMQKIYMESRYSFEASASLYNAMVQNMSELNGRLTEQEYARKKAADQDFGKILMKNKWSLIDKYYKEPETFLCDICNARIDTQESDIFESRDIFNGGILKRYRCPVCGAIVGPLKMLELSEEELGEEYRLHYTLYNEGNTTEAEIKTFYLLNPQKGKKYLNYGCGAWSETISTLRAQGYDVWGYDPYAPVASEYVYNSMEQMQDIRFDGLFSHDLLEHLRYPVKAFEDFKNLLTDSGRMAHATACYKYVYEYTRFHLFFYTGRSIETICEQAGLKLVEQAEVESELYFCSIFEKQIEVYT